MDESVEYASSGNSSIAKKVYFLQEMEMCQGNLNETIQWFS